MRSAVDYGITDTKNDRCALVNYCSCEYWLAVASDFGDATNSVILHRRDVDSVESSCSMSSAKEKLKQIEIV